MLRTMITSKYRYKIFMLSALLCFQCWISGVLMQLDIDQLFDASANEISFFILWRVLGTSASAILSHLILDCIASEYDTFYIKTLTVAIFLSLVPCSDSVKIGL